jgi:hypothetical protein
LAKLSATARACRCGWRSSPAAPCQPVAWHPLITVSSNPREPERSLALQRLRSAAHGARIPRRYRVSRVPWFGPPRPHALVRRCDSLVFATPATAFSPRIDRSSSEGVKLGPPRWPLPAGHEGSSRSATPHRPPWLDRGVDRAACQRIPTPGERLRHGGRRPGDPKPQHPVTRHPEHQNPPASRIGSRRTLRRCVRWPVSRLRAGVASAAGYSSWRSRNAVRTRRRRHGLASSSCLSAWLVSRSRRLLILNDSCAWSSCLRSRARVPRRSSSSERSSSRRSTPQSHA